jgi:uncharacterized protein YecT (DUF1311 family)
MPPIQVQTSHPGPIPIIPVMPDFPPRSSRFVFFGSLLALATAQAVVESEGSASHFYGSKSRPQVEISIEIEESSDSPTYLSLKLLENNGVATRADTRMPMPASDRKTKAGIELSGTNRLHGREFRYRANLSRDRSTLEVMEPKTVLLADGTKLELAGRYGDLSEKSRASAAKAALEPIDKELNAVYRKLIATLDPVAQEQLRAEQRRWLKYRDFTLLDGDNASIIGPGTAPHFRQQGQRTLERIEFLKALLAKQAQEKTGNTLFADGRGGTCAVGRVDDAVFFALVVEYPHLRDSDKSLRDLSCTVSGLARPAGEHTWAAKPGDLVMVDEALQAEPLRLAFDPAGVLRVEAAGPAGLLARVVSGGYHPLRAAAPAEEPLRSLLCQLPETAFQETTDGLDAAAKKSLALTGSGGTFKIEKESQDDLVLRHPDGTVELRRLRGDDGAAVVAVEQTNGPRNHLMQLWRKARPGDPFTLWDEILPKPPVETFFSGELGDDAARIKDRSRHVILFEEGTRLLVYLNVDNPDERQPDYSFALDWDGFGFAVERENMLDGQRGGVSGRSGHRHQLGFPHCQLTQAHFSRSGTHAAPEP